MWMSSHRNLYNSLLNGTWVVQVFTFISSAIVRVVHGIERRSPTNGRRLTEPGKAGLPVSAVISKKSDGRTETEPIGTRKIKK